MSSSAAKGGKMLQRATLNALSQLGKGWKEGTIFSLSRAFASGPPDCPDLKPYEYHRPDTYVVSKRGEDLLHDPWCNKGTAFPLAERDRLGLRGLVPPAVLSVEEQEKKFLADFHHPRELIPPEEVKNGGVTSEMARKWKSLQELMDRNETLFYKVLMDNFSDMAPIVYTPTVGWVCVNHHRVFRRPRGMFFSAKDKGEMAAMMHNWPQNDVQAIVVTDGSRILGLGDLGINGLGIPIGKLDLYCAAGGFHPSKVLPVVIDVGTNNEALRNDPYYCGLRMPRMQGQEYYDLIDEFTQAVFARWPKCVLQFEDFSMDHALALLNRYRHKHLVFNDDIQGTAAVALSGLYGAMRVMGKPLSYLKEQRVICLGAGSAGMGVVAQIASGMQKQGASEEQANRNFWVLDHNGLISTARPDLADHVKPFARPEAGLEGKGLLELIKEVKPTVLLGLAGAGRLFTEEVVKTMDSLCTSQRPIIFPMSNPTSKMECTSEEAITWTKGRVVFASGSPQPNVTLDGKEHGVSQANNMYIFPGLAMGAHVGQCPVITDDMIMKASETLPTLISDEDVAKGKVFPQLQDIRNISAEITLAVIKQAAKEGLLYGPALLKLQHHGEEEVMKYIVEHQFVPKYASLVHHPEGVVSSP